MSAVNQEGRPDIELVSKPSVPPEVQPWEEKLPYTHAEPQDDAVQTLEQYLNGWLLAVVITSLCFGTFLVALDTTIIGVAIPKLTSQFRSLEDIAWYGTAYLLIVTSLQPTFGNFYKYFHVKTVYISSIAIFEVGSIICATAQNSLTFIVGRAIAGLGAAGLFQGALAIIGYTVALEKRPMYIGIVASIFGLSICIGPVLGGAFVDHVSWRWCFWINVPIGGAVILIILIFLKLKRSNEKLRSLSLKVRISRMDIVGTILFIGAICCLMLALQWGGQSLPWKSSKIIGLFVGFGLLLIPFCWVQWKRGDEATLPLRVLRKRSILLVHVLHPHLLSISKGVSATASGVQFIAMMLPQTLFALISGGLAFKWGFYVPYMVLGTAIGIVGFGLSINITVGTSTVTWAAYLVVCGLGSGLAMNLPYTALQAVLQDVDTSIGNAILVFSSQLGGAISLAICQTLFVTQLVREIPKHISTISPASVVAAGAANLGQLTSSPEELAAIRASYAAALRPTYILALAAMCCALMCACGMERLNLKTVASQRKAQEEN